ncbi:MAG: DegV family protein [Candidatus Eremiobacteraeota bacterium]|nr:DegV family protein [Candidatus Eremiobacteraeota bacterium]
MGVAIVTDSGCDLSHDQARRHGISIVPVYLLFGTQRFRDGIDLDRGEFYRRIAIETVRTEAPASDDFKAAFLSCMAKGDDVVCITLSSQFSLSYANAKEAAADCGGRVVVIDTRAASGIQVLFALYAAELVREGASALEIAAVVAPQPLQALSYFAVPDMRQLAESGRAPKALVALGAMLNVSLILKINEDGAIAPAGQSRSFEKTCEIMVDAVARTIAFSKSARIAVSHARAPDTAIGLLASLRAKLGRPPAYAAINETASTIAAHLGCGAVGIFAIVP